jgi:hypothetical protein
VATRKSLGREYERSGRQPSLFSFLASSFFHPRGLCERGTTQRAFPFLEPAAVSAAAQFISRHLPRAMVFPPGRPKKGVYSLTGNASFPFHAEPAQDKVLRRGTRHVVNRVANALRQAASSLIRSRRLPWRPVPPPAHQAGGAPKAITAMAHRLARLVYRMLKYGQQYVDQGTDYYEQRYRNQQIQLLRKKSR